MTRSLTLLAAALLVFGCVGHATDAVNSVTKSSGRIRGVVRFKGTVPEPSFETPKEHDDICGHQIPLERLALGDGNGVQDAFVYLDGVQNAGAFPKPSSVLVD